MSKWQGISENDFREFWSTFEEMWVTYYMSPLFTVAAVNGAAFAGGCFEHVLCVVSASSCYEQVQSWRCPRTTGLCRMQRMYKWA